MNRIVFIFFIIFLNIFQNVTKNTFVMAVKDKELPRIIVIGAGAAGIAATTKLINAGFNNILILESQDRIGGRINTIKFADNVIDLGAEWCYGEENNVVYETVQNMNVLGSEYFDNDQQYVCLRSNNEIVSKDTCDLLHDIAYSDEDEDEDKDEDEDEELNIYNGSYGAILADQFWIQIENLTSIDRIIAREYFENMQKLLSNAAASDNLYELSIKGQQEYWQCNGTELLNWKDKGYKKFLEILMKVNDSVDEITDMGLLNGHIKLNKRVVNIDWSDVNKTRLHLWNGDIIDADYVISTVSLGVLKENYLKMFKPELPMRNRRAIEGLNFGSVDKFFIEFNETFGPKEWDGFLLLWRDEDLIELRNSSKFWLEGLYSFYRLPYQPNVLSGYIYGSYARHMETLTKDEVLSALMWLFGKFINFPFYDPINFERSSWYINPNFRGATSYRSLYTEQMRTSAADLATPLLNEGGRLAVQFAGEATSDHYYSTVHGAVESGWREAERLMKFYNDK